MLSFFTASRTPLFEALAVAVVFTVTALTQRHTSVWFRAIGRAFGRLANRRGLSIALIGLLAFGASAMLSLASRIPEPEVHDEFSYLLQADTFAHGRLTNPTHPMWVHFETFHVIQRPTYASMYPPAQGLILALGQAIAGHPIVGVWISTALACAAVYWMLLAWVPSWWALLGGLLTVLHPSIMLFWGQMYWGGQLAMMGGALVFGALRRIIRRPRARDALLMGVGLAILANRRPYEGLVASLPVAMALLAWMLGKSRPPIRVSLTRIVLPILAILVPTAVAMGFYNWRVTGDPLRMPYQVAYETQAVAPSFLWQQPRPAPIYHHKVMEDFHTRWALDWYMEAQSFSGFVKLSIEKFKRLWIFYHGLRPLRLVLTLPLFMLPWHLRNRWPRFALLTLGVFMAGLLAVTWVGARLVSPITAVVAVLVLQGTRRLSLWRWHGAAIGKLLARSLVVVAIASFVVAFVQQLQDRTPGWQFERAGILKQLRQDGQRHLVIVRYGIHHWPDFEWVYNEADIDGAKVVWAREMDATENRKLLDYFKGRQAWLLDVDDDELPPKLIPYLATQRP